jgi:fluoroacetyl-CoA thioesterase
MGEEVEDCRNKSRRKGTSLRSRDKKMKTVPRIGMTGEERVVVGPANRITFADDLMPAVLATPWLVAHLEYASRQAIAGCLEDHERSVGTFVEVEHLAPVPEGFTVVCKARVIRVDGAVVTFQVEAHDDVEPVARGLHRRRVIDARRFARRIEKKRMHEDAPSGGTRQDQGSAPIANLPGS